MPSAIEEMENEVEEVVGIVFPRIKRRYLEVAPEVYLDLYETNSLTNERGENMIPRMRELENFLVQFYNRKRVTPNDPNVLQIVQVENNIYDSKLRYNVLVRNCWTLARHIVRWELSLDNLDNLNNVD